MGEKGPGIIELDHDYLPRAADVGAGEVVKRRAARRYYISGKCRLAFGILVPKPVGVVLYGLYQRCPLGRAARAISYHAAVAVRRSRAETTRLSSNAMGVTSMPPLNASSINALTRGPPLMWSLYSPSKLPAHVPSLQSSSSNAFSCSGNVKPGNRPERWAVCFNSTPNAACSISDWQLWSGHRSAG